jgi:oligopeptide/dipeptide ABC transporter ATP-binding protein
MRLRASHSESTVTPLLEVKGLRKSFALTGPRTWAARLRGQRPAIRAVDGVSLAIAKGETLGLVGESGCGKSTVARCLLRVIEPTAGNIRFAGEEITALDGRQLRNTRRAMQMVYQDPAAALNPRFSARRTIEEPLRLHFNMTAAERHERLEAVIADVGLGADLVERYPHELSDGQRQRVNIARAVAAHPSLVVLDEPTSALDVSLRSRVILLLEALQKRLGLSFLFISHDIATVKYLAHRIAVMYLGVIVEEADSASLFTAPRHPYTRALLSSVPVPDPDFRHERLVLNGEIPSPTQAFVGCRLRSRCPLAEAVCAEPVPRREVAPGHHVLCHLA